MGIVTGETIIGANMFKDLFAGIRDIVGGRAGAYEEVLSEAKDTSIQEMMQRAQALGARSSSARLLPTGRKNAIVGINIDYETVGANGSMLDDVEKDADVRCLIHNMMELYEGTTILNIVVECQKVFQEHYFSMKGNDWRHLIRDYVRKVTERPNLQENEVFRYVMAG